MQTAFHFFEFDALCVDGPLAGRCYPQQTHDHVHTLGPAEIPYRPVQDERGEWLYEYAPDLDLTPE